MQAHPGACSQWGVHVCSAGAVWCHEASFHFVTSDLLKQLWKHDCLSFFVLLALRAGTNGCSGTLRAHACVHAHLCKWCLIVLCVINCCDSRNVCVTSTPWSESISWCFWVSLAGYHSNTNKHTHSVSEYLNTHTAQTGHFTTLLLILVS